jgi:hypothetical protein
MQRIERIEPSPKPDKRKPEMAGVPEFPQLQAIEIQRPSVVGLLRSSYDKK